MFVLIFSFLACSGSNDSGTSGMPYCEETSQSIARDDDTAIGIPASDLLDALPFAEDLALSWAEGVEDSLTWSFEADESTLVCSSCACWLTSVVSPFGRARRSKM